MVDHELDVSQNLLANGSHVSLLEPQKLVLLFETEQVEVFEAILFDLEGFVHFAINDAALEVKLAHHISDVEKEIVHEVANDGVMI